MYYKPDPIREILAREMKEARQLIEEVKHKLQELPEVIPETKNHQK